MKIVVADYYPMNPGDLSWDPLKALGECQFYASTPPAEIVPRCQEAEAVLTNRVVLTREILAQLPRLRYVGLTATGANSVDLAAAKDRGIAVTNVPGYSTASVAQAVFSLILAHCSKVTEHAAACRQGYWESHQAKTAGHPFPLDLHGKTLGIIGFGQIGRQVARIALAFGMKILVHGRTRPEALPPEVLWTPLEMLLRESDIVSISCPLTEATRGLICKRTLSLMKPTALLVNTARGAIIEENDLAEALNHGHIAGAALDVLAVEPPLPDHPLLRAKNCLVTPHIAWCGQEARTRLLLEVVENLKVWRAGGHRNRLA